MISKIIKAAFQLSLFENLHFIQYQILLKIGWYQLATPMRSKNQRLDTKHLLPAWFDFWSSEESIISKNPTNKEIIRQADSILSGNIQLFGMIEADLDLSDNTDLRHWSRSRTILEDKEQKDIKFIWEPARFAWAIRLGQAFFLTKEEKYAECFWKELADFTGKNPLNQGPNWQSAQEVAFRLIALVITLTLMKDADCSSKVRQLFLQRSIADHADRIPPTLSYAKAQNNNHLISEAVGLFTAGTFLPGHPQAKKWKKCGLKWFRYAIKNQIYQNGEYTQHSTNYHRMMLMLALWMNKMCQINDICLKQAVIKNLSLACDWLKGQLDITSGCVSNTGHNDGSLILHFSAARYSDFRPIIQAASRVFQGESPLENGPWDDLSSWLGITSKVQSKPGTRFFIHQSAPRIGDADSWASLRAVQYKSRPAHADQLHLNLWFQGINITLDPGTYQYNALPPWDNSLTQTYLHNTITINDKDQMLHSGRFLWLDWAQAKVIKYQKSKKISAEHYGYKKIGLTHRRVLTRISINEWDIEDNLYSEKVGETKYKCTLHWLLPDWPIKFSEKSLILKSPFGMVYLQISSNHESINSKVEIYKEGKSIGHDKNLKPLLGWYSPTYGYKISATSIIFSVKDTPPIKITSHFKFS